jgi:hypothetical protein
MKKLLFTQLAVLAFGTTMLLSSCGREGNNDWSFAVDNSAAEEAFQDIYSRVNQVGEGNDDNRRAGCATTTHTMDTLGTFPDTVRVDYGTSCVGLDGRTRSGALVIIFSGRWRDIGTVVTVTSDNYSVNNYSVVGSQTITVNQLNAANNPSYTISTANAQITNPQGETATWSCNKTFEWVEGVSTSFASNGSTGVTDDVFHITGSANGTSRQGTSYSATITNRLVRRMDCRWLTAGTVEITPTGGDARTIDFGDGTCDNQATVSFRRWSTSITLLQ